MTKAIDIKLLRFYLWVGVAYMLLSLFSHLGKYPGNFFPLLLDNVWRIGFVMVLNFVFFEYTVPFVLRKRRYIVYNILIGLFLLWVHSMFWSYGMYGWRNLGVALRIYTPLAKFTSENEALTSSMAYSMGSVFFLGIIRHIYNYVKLKQAAQQLRIEKQEAELNYLRSQTNPHFLFNTLNNIYSLARSKSDLAPESILRLSKIMRYMLYETRGDYIAIEQELRIINNYIELEKLRYDESLRINFNQDVENMLQALPPLLLIPLVENAFKHGVSETRTNPFVDIHLSVKNRQLRFVVRNSAEPASNETEIKENIGLFNLRRQLQLLYTDYNLTIRPGASEFVVILTINLGSHV